MTASKIKEFLMGIENGSNSFGSSDQRSVLLQKIRDLLAGADPDTWRKGGEPLNSERTFEKPRTEWEEVYTLEISKGTLVFRRSTPLKSEFLGKGFKLMSYTKPEFYVELRPLGWHHSELTDPFKRSRMADRSCTVLAESSIAEELFAYVEQAYLDYHTQKQSEFDREATLIIKKLLEGLKHETVNTWKQSQPEEDEICYSSRVGDCTVDVSCITKSGREQFLIRVKRGKSIALIKDSALGSDLYSAVDELGQTSRLQTLSKVLEGL